MNFAKGGTYAGEFKANKRDGYGKSTSPGKNSKNGITRLSRAAQTATHLLTIETSDQLVTDRSIH
jgi:hypothetical protein